MLSTKAHRRTFDRLRSIPLFEGCTARDLALIDANTFELDLPAGALLCGQGRLGQEAFIVVTGRLAVEIDGVEVASIGPGGICGEMALIDHGPRTATVRAATPVRVLVLDAKEFHHVVQRVPAVARRIVAELTRRLRHADAELAGARR